jgi:N12 class adenine-specific DNA methylase
VADYQPDFSDLSSGEKVGGEGVGYQPDFSDVGRPSLFERGKRFISDLVTPSRPESPAPAAVSAPREAPGGNGRGMVAPAPLAAPAHPGAPPAPIPDYKPAGPLTRAARIIGSQQEVMGIAPPPRPPGIYAGHPETDPLTTSDIGKGVRQAAVGFAGFPVSIAEHAAEFALSHPFFSPYASPDPEAAGVLKKAAEAMYSEATERFTQGTTPGSERVARAIGLPFEAVALPAKGARKIAERLGADEPTAQVVEDVGILVTFGAIPGAVRVPKMIADSTWYRKLTIKERGLVLMSVEQMKAAGMTEAQIIRIRPEEWQKAYERRGGGQYAEKPPEAATGPKSAPEPAKAGPKAPAEPLPTFEPDFADLPEKTTETEAPALRPAVLSDGEQYVGLEGAKHDDVIDAHGLDAHTAERGFVDPQGNFMSRAEAATWLDKHDPETAKKLREQEAGELHSEDYREAAGIEPTKEAQGEPTPQGQIEARYLGEHPGDGGRGAPAEAGGGGGTAERGRPSEEEGKEVTEGQVRQYASDAIKKGSSVKSISLVGSRVSGKGKDVDLLYEMDLELPKNPVEAADAVTAAIEVEPGIDLDTYDTHIKVGDRYFHVQDGAGREVVENTEYGKEQAGKPKVVLAGTPKDLPGDLRKGDVTFKDIEIGEVIDGENREFYAYADGAEIAGPFKSRDEADHYKRNFDETDVIPISKGKRPAKKGELRPEPHEVSDAPVTPPGDRWTGDRGAIPGEPSMFLDGDAETAKAAIVEVPNDKGEATWEARNAKGESLGQFTDLEAAAKAAEAHVDKKVPPVEPPPSAAKTEAPGTPSQVGAALSSNEALTRAQFKIGDTVYFRTGTNKEPQKITHINSEGDITVEGGKASYSPTDFTKRLYKGIPVDKLARTLTEKELDTILAPDPIGMEWRNKDLSKYEGDPRFYVYLKPGEIGYQTNLSPHLQPVHTDYRLVRDFLKDGTLPERGKELQKIADRYRQIDDTISEAAAIKSAAMVRTAIERGSYNTMLHPQNKISRNIFYEITGQKLPAGVSATQKFFTLKPFEKRAEWGKEKAAPEGAPVIDEILSPDLEYERFVSELTPEQKETAKAWIAKNPRNPLGQIESIKRALKNSETLASEDFKKASESAGKMPEGFKVEVPGVAEKPADQLSKFRATLDRNGAARIGNVDYKIQQRADGGYFYSRVEDGFRISKGPAGPPGIGGWGRDKAIQEAVEEAGFDVRGAAAEVPRETVKSPLTTEKKEPGIEIEGGVSDDTGNRPAVRESGLLEHPSGMAPGQQAPVREGTVRQGPGEAPDVPVTEDETGLRPGVPAAGKGPSVKRGRGDRDVRSDSTAPAGESTGATPGAPEVRNPPLVREPRRVEDHNHVIGTDDVLFPAGKVTRINANVKAIELAKSLEAENRNPSPAEKKVLAQFTGWGALAQDVFDFDKSVYYDKGKTGTIPDWQGDVEKYRKWFERIGKKLHPEYKGLLTQEEWDAAKASTLNAHYTSQEVISRGLWPIAERLGIKGGSIVEPSAGIGHILGLMPEGIAKRANVKAVELDRISGSILKRLYPEANVQITGFQNAQAMKDNSADLVISNFPFGDYPVTDKKHKDYSGWNIHNYFFARSIDLARPGGIVIGITSHYTLDAAGGGKMREYLGSKADLVGAVRLPSTAFEKSAGTEVTTDIIVFRKKDAASFTGAEPFRNVLTVETAKGEQAPVNEYFVKHPEMVLGEHSMKGTMYGGEGKEYTLLPGKEPLAEALVKAVEQFPTAIAGEGAQVTRDVLYADQGEKQGILLEKDGKIYVNDGGELIAPRFTRSPAKVIAAKRYMSVRDRAKELIRLQLDEGSTDAQIVEQRGKLNLVYDDFVKRHGPISEKVNRWLNEDGEYPLALSLEATVHITKTETPTDGPNKGVPHTFKVKTFAKAPIFTERTIFPFVEPKTAESSEDAIKISLTYRNKLDAAYVAKLLDSTVEDVTDQLTSKGLAYLDPQSGILSTPEEYLSGNVRDKLLRAQEAAKDDVAFETNVEALKRVQPAPIEIDQIYVRIGSTWIPPETYHDFIREVMGSDVSVRYYETAENSGFEMDSPRYGLSALTTSTWGVEGANALDLIKDSLNLKRAEVYDTWYEDRTPKRAINREKTLAAQNMQGRIQAEFSSWVKRNEKWATELKSIYNRDKNNLVLKQFDVPSMKYYPGASHSITLRPHQKRGVSRVLQESCLLAHSVGTGKTYIFATAAMEMRRLGTAKKPLIVVQGSTINQYARAFRELYPTSRILIPNERQLQATNRKKILSQVATGDWDSVIIPHSVFDMLSVDPAKEAAFIREQIADLVALIAEAKATGAGRQTVKQYEKMKIRKEERLKNLMSIEKEDILHFDQLGIDALLIDEAHRYKRSEFFTKMDKIKGIDRGSSSRSLLLLLKSKEVRDRTGGKNVIIATGTPISNTVAELWTMLRYIRPDLMADYGISNFDSFAANFGNVVSQVEETETGDFKQIDRFAQYVNGPELMKIWRTASDVILPEDVKVSRPTIKGGAPRQIMLERPEELAEFIRGIKAQRQAWDKLIGKEKMEHPEVPMVLYGLAKKAAIDLRLVNSGNPDLAGSKVNRSVEEVFQTWRDHKTSKATQVVFSDLFQSADKKFNLFQDIKRKLVRKGIPEREIAIIHDFKNDEAREELFSKVNDGDIRVVMGSTEKLGVGVNMQERLIRAHHLDIPNRPMDFEQRNGRIWRPGNTNETIDITTYGHKKTLDSTASQRLITKQKFINQILRGDVQDRSFEDPFDPTQASFQDMMAAFGDPKVREKFGLENQIRDLRSLKESHERETGRARETIWGNEKTIDGQKKQKTWQIEVNGRLEKAFPDGKVVGFSLAEKGKPAAEYDRDGFVEKLAEVAKTIRATVEERYKETSKHKFYEDRAKGGTISPMLSGTVNGLPFGVQIQIDTAYADSKYEGGFTGVQIGGDEVRYAILPEEKDLAMSRTVNTPRGVLQSIEAQIKHAMAFPGEMQEHIDHLTKNNRDLAELLDKPFEQADALAEKEKRLAEVDAELKATKNEDLAVETATDVTSPEDDTLPPPDKPGILGSEEGFLDVSFLMPGIEAGRNITGGIKSLVLPTSKSPEHLRAAEVLGSKLGSSHRDAEIATKSLKKDSRMFDKMGVHDPKVDLADNPGVKFMSDMSKGRVMDPKYQPIADKVKNLFDDRVRKLEKAGAEMRTVRENYFPGMWTQESRKAFNQAAAEVADGIKKEGGKVPETIEEWSAMDRAAIKERTQEILKEGGKGSDKSALAYLSRRPLKGKESFRKQKVFDDIMDGVDFGLVPISPNPIDLVKLKLAEMDRSIMANRALREWEAKGDVAEVPYNRPVPEGYAKINDKYGTIWDPPSIPVWKMLREIAKTGKRDLYFAQFGKEVFPSALEVSMGADDTMKQEANGLAWETKAGKTLNIHAMRRGTGRSYSQLIIEKLLENHDAFEEQAPTIYAKLQEIADDSAKLRTILGTPTFEDLNQKLPVGGWVMKGYRVAKKPVAEILNNFLSSSIYNSPYFGTAFKAYMGAANVLNQSQLGVGSAFHAGFTSADVQISHNAEVVKDVYGVVKGNRTFGDLGRTIKKVPAAMISNPRRGAKILKEWRTPTLEVPTNVPVGQLPKENAARVAMIAKAAELAGGMFHIERGLRTEWTEKQIREWYGNQKIKAAARSPVVLIELLAKPIMDWLVPRQKGGIFGELAGRIIEMNPGKTMEELTPQFRQAWNRVDARLGQVVYDRLFINNMAKNFIQALIRAPGWTGGTIGEIGGAPKDLINFFAEWKRTGKAPENIPDRVAYVLALLATVTAANWILTYAFTGEQPEGMDWWAFRTGGFDEKGRPERFILPTYAKDFFAWYQNWGHTLLAKTHPLVGMMGDIYRNRDYYGVKILNEDDPWIQQALQVGVYGYKQFEPFWIRGAGKEAERGGGLMKTLQEQPQKILAPQIGIMPATSAYTMSEFEKYARKVAEERHPLGTRTKAEADRSKMKQKLEQALRREEPGAEIDVDVARAAGEITRKEAEEIKRRAKEDAITKTAKGMTLDDLARGIPKATEKEKEILRPIFKKKIYNAAGKISGEKKQEYLEALGGM